MKKPPGSMAATAFVVSSPAGREFSWSGIYFTSWSRRFLKNPTDRSSANIPRLMNRALASLSPVGARPLHFWLLQAVLAVIWIAVWQLGLLLERSDHASLWFPPAALTFAAFLAVGPRAAIPVIVGSIVTTFQGAAVHSDPTPASHLLLSGAAFGAVHFFAYAIAGWVFRRSLVDARLDTPGAVVSFLLVSTVASLMAALLGPASLIATGAQIDLLAEFMPWWIGDLVGMVTLAPVFLLAIDGAVVRVGLPSEGWWQNLRHAPADSTVPRFVIKLTGLMALALLLGTLGATASLDLPVSLVVYALIVPLMWIAHTEGSLRTIATVASLSVAVVLVTNWFGSGQQAFESQAAMIAIAGTGLFNLTVPAMYADNRRLRDLVDFDGLTGARSRAGFLEKAEEEMDRAQRYGIPVAVVAIDVDHFKSINDTLGHAVGDRVLTRFGSVCLAELRRVDLFGRMGGEEFAVLLPGADSAAAVQTAERLRVAIANAEWSSISKSLAVTASFGVSMLRAPAESLTDALASADRALYAAKVAGRNRVLGA